MIKSLIKIFNKKTSIKHDLEEENVNIKTKKLNKTTDFLDPEIILPSKDNVAIGYSMIDNVTAGYHNTTIGKSLVNKSNINLKNSIVVKIFHEYNHRDFEFIGNSKIDGMPMYVFTGHIDTFKKHDIIFEELW